MCVLALHQLLLPPPLLQEGNAYVNVRGRGGRAGEGGGAGDEAGGRAGQGKCIRRWVGECSGALDDVCPIVPPPFMLQVHDVANPAGVIRGQVQWA